MSGLLTLMEVVIKFTVVNRNKMHQKFKNKSWKVNMEGYEGVWSLRCDLW